MNTFLKIVSFRLQLYSFETLSEVVSYTVISCAALLFAIITLVVSEPQPFSTESSYAVAELSTDEIIIQLSEQAEDPAINNSLKNQNQDLQIVSLAKHSKHQLRNLVYYLVLAVGFSYSQEYVLR